jgi:hypothetical protein
MCSACPPKPPSADRKFWTILVSVPIVLWLKQ